MAFGNHFRVEDESRTQLVSYNNGVAFCFQLLSKNKDEALVNYVGVLKDILELDYGALQTKVILLRCEWVKT